jgi:hypothetical protein
MTRFSLLFFVATLLVAAGCGGNNGGTNPPVINSINLNPGSVAAASVVQLSGSITGGSAADIKTWTVSTGQLSATAPDFGLVLRGTAKAGSVASLSTTAATVYWITPVAPGSATITLAVGTASKTQTINIGASLITLEVTDQAGGKKLATVRANGVTDLYQAAFRVTYSSAWQPEAVTQGDFLGPASDTLFLGLTNQTGFVPVSLTRKGNVSGIDGAGVLATVLFSPAAGTSSARELSSVPLGLMMVELRNSKDQLIPASK